MSDFDLSQRVTTNRDVVLALRRLDERLDRVERRLRLVEELPASAPFGALIRLTTGPAAGRASIYVGNGPSQPLTKLTPTPL